MIAMRAEAKFEEISVDDTSWFASAKYTIPGIDPSSFRIDFHSIAVRRGMADEAIELEMGPKLIRASIMDAPGKPKGILDWFTTEKILYDKWNGHPELDGLDAFRSFATYELLYVGISKEEDSFTRLVERAHEKRVRILSNEMPLAPGARVTDEIIFFFFEIDPIMIRVLDLKHAHEITSWLKPEFDKKRMIADAEKAFTSVMQTKYNTIKFSQYPEGGDGLYGQGIDRYGYIIAEDVTFTSNGAKIRGSRRSLQSNISGVGPDVDMILIDGDSVDLVSSDDPPHATTG